MSHRQNTAQAHRFSSHIIKERFFCKFLKQLDHQLASFLELEGLKFFQLFSKSTTQLPILIQGFSQNFWWWGDSLPGMISGLRQGQSQMGGHLALGTESDEWGTSKNCLPRPKMPPTAKLEQILVF